MTGRGRRGGRLSSSGCIARLVGRRGRRRGAWLRCRRAARLRPAFAGWGLRGPGGLAGRRARRRARLPAGCRGRVGGGGGACQRLKTPLICDAFVAGEATPLPTKLHTPTFLHLITLY